MEDTQALPLPSRTLLLFERLRCIEFIEFENLLRHVAMEAKFLDLNKLWSCKNGQKNRKN